MPVPGQRDADETAVVLTRWLEGQVAGATDVVVSGLEVPQASGFSNETFLFDASWVIGDERVEGRYVLRAQPSMHGLFPHIDVVAQQYRTMQQLAEVSDVPLPAVRWAEPDPSVLGQPFFIMDRLDGRVPSDQPVYMVEGFVADLDAADRRTLCRSGIEAMARVHQVDVTGGRFDHLDRAAQGHPPPGPAQLQSYLRGYHEWTWGSEPHPVLDPTWQWMTTNWPDDGDRVDLTWGDARLGNQMFRGLECIGVFDWEMAALTNAESDLGWWLFMQKAHCSMGQCDLLEGLLDDGQVVDYWQELTGRTAHHVDFYTVLGGYHFSLVMVALVASMNRVAPGLMPEDYAINNSGTAVLRDLLGL